MYKNLSNIFIPSKKLYIDSSDGIVICTNKITNNSKLIKRNRLLIINIKTGKLKIHKCEI